MAIYTIGDLHLSLKHPKPMNIFGNNWDDHEQKIKEDWQAKVKENDLEKANEILLRNGLVAEIDETLMTDAALKTKRSYI